MHNVFYIFYFFPSDVPENLANVANSHTRFIIALPCDLRDIFIVTRQCCRYNNDDFADVRDVSAVLNENRDSRYPVKLIGDQLSSLSAFA